MATQGPRGALTFASVDPGGGAQAWINPDRAVSSDDSYASCNFIGNGFTQYLRCTNFGFTVPAGSSIDGIVATNERNSPSQTVTDLSLSLVKAGSRVGTTKQDGAAWLSTDATITYGSSTDLWGTTWTVAEVNNSSFGIDIQAQGNAGDTARVDRVQITIHYTAGGAPATVDKLLYLGVG